MFRVSSAASPVIDLSDRIPVGGGKERDIHILGVSPEYRIVRNLVIVSGTVFRSTGPASHNKVAVIVDKLATGFTARLTMRSGRS